MRRTPTHFFAARPKIDLRRAVGLVERVSERSMGTLGWTVALLVPFLAMLTAVYASSFFLLTGGLTAMAMVILANLME